MPKTTNRLSQFDALESKSRLTGAPVPLTSNAYPILQWSLERNIVDKIELIIKVDDTFPVDIGLPISVTGINISDLAGYIPEEDDPNPNSLNETYNVLSITHTVPHFYIHVSPENESSFPPSMNGLTSTATSSSVYALYPHRWESDIGTISLTNEAYDNKSRYALKVNPEGTAPITVSLPSIGQLTITSGEEIVSRNQMLIDDNGKDFSFNGKIYCDQLVEVSCFIEHVESGVVEPVLTTVYPGRFTAFRSNVEELPISNEDSYEFNVYITVSGHGGNVFYITSPNLIEDFLYNRNPYVYSAKRSMPDFYWYLDSSQINPSAPLHRLIDCMMTGARGVFDEYMRIYPYEPGQLGLLAEQFQTNNTHSVLVDPDYIDQRYAPWLSQFNGHRLKKNIFMLKNTITEETFAEPTSLFESIGAKESFLKWQLRNGYYGRAAGTTEALMEASKQVLHFTKDGEDSTYFVSITPHYQSDPFKIFIQTLVNETIDCEDDGEESYAVLDAVQMAKPAGYKIYHQAVDVVEFRIGDRLGTNPIGDTSDGMYPLGNVIPNTSATIVSVSRTDNVATLTINNGTSGSQFQVDNEIIVSGLTDSTYNGEYTVTAVTNATVSYLNDGPDGSAPDSGVITGTPALNLEEPPAPGISLT